VGGFPSAARNRPSRLGFGSAPRLFFPSKERVQLGLNRASRRLIQIGNEELDGLVALVPAEGDTEELALRATLRALEPRPPLAREEQREEI